MPKKLQDLFLTLTITERDEMWRWATSNNVAAQIIDRVCRPCGCWNVLYPAHGPDCTIKEKAHGHCA